MVRMDDHSVYHRTALALAFVFCYFCVARYPGLCGDLACKKMSRCSIAFCCLSLWIGALRFLESPKWGLENWPTGIIIFPKHLPFDPLRRSMSRPSPGLVVPRSGRYELPRLSQIHLAKRQPFKAPISSTKKITRKFGSVGR